MKWSPALALLLLFANCSSPHPAEEPQARAARELQRLLEEGVDRGIPGMAAAVATSEGVVWSGVAGLADLEAGTPVRADMLFGIGSITKTFVAVVILQLVEEGRLSLDATAGSLLGPAVDGIPNADVATVAQLLNHTGGVPSWEDDPTWIRDGRGANLDVDRGWGKTETLPYINGHDPLAAPGVVYRYANTNYTLLGMIIEKVTGEEAVDEIHRRILEPLGLTDIHLEGFEAVPAEQLPRRYHWATPTFREDAGVNEAFSEVRSELIDVSRSNLSVEWTAGGMVASARDLVLYVVALRDGLLLEPASMAVMLDWFPAGDGVQIGHNVFRYEYPDGLALIGHSGSVLGFTGSMYWIEGADVAVAVVANVGTMHSGRVPASAGSVARAREFIDEAMKVAGAGLLPPAFSPDRIRKEGSRRFDRWIALEDSAATSANVSIGDVDADGHQDIVLVKGRHWPLADLVLLGDGSGSFLPAYPVGSQADRSYSGVLVDMDRDGDLDIVVSNDSPDAKVVHLNDGSGRFQVGSTFGRPEWSTRHVSVDDLNGDALPDVVLANRGGNESVPSYICFGVAGGGFDEECAGFSRGSATTITSADFNEDGALDLVVPQRDGGQSHIYMNDGKGGFEERRPFGPPDAEIRSAKAADLDGDHILDLVVIDERTGPALHLGQPDGTFSSAEPLGASEPTPYAIAVADLDGNGRPDILVGYVESRPIVFFNDGPGTFVPVPFGDDEGVAYAFAVGDLDEDGLLDIAMARSGAPNMLYFGDSLKTPGSHPSSS